LVLEILHPSINQINQLNDQPINDIIQLSFNQKPVARTTWSASARSTWSSRAGMPIKVN